MSSETSIGRGDGRFRPTLWTLVLRTTDPSKRRGALDELIHAYWRPVYFFIRRRGHAVEEAKDLTQGFFAAALEDDFFEAASPDRGKFRTFLLAALVHFLSKQYRRARAAKRGGHRIVTIDVRRVEASLARSDGSPEAVFEREWATAVIEGAMARLKTECADDADFDTLAPFLTRSGKHGRELAAALGWTEAQVARRLFSLRARLKALVEEQVRQSAATDEDFAEEMSIFRRF